MDTEATPPPSKWRLVRRAIGIVFVLWLVAAGFTAKSARDDLLAGKSALVDLAALDPLEADLVTLNEELGAAREPVSSGTKKLDSPLLWPVRPLPVVGRQVAAARGIATTADAVLAQTEKAVDAAILVQTAMPEQRVEHLKVLGESLRGLEAVIDDRDLGPGNNLFGSISSAHTDAEAALAEIGVEVKSAATVVNGLESFLADSHYLLLGANVNEMQIGGGTPLNFGEVLLRDGEFSVSEIQTILEAPLDGPTPLVDEDIGELWGFLTPTNDFKKVMLTHRFSEYSAPQALVMYEDAKGKQLEGVLLVDSLALQGLLEVVGPVIVREREFSADNVLDYIFVEQYVEETAQDADGERRYDRLAALASAVFTKVADGEWDTVEMIRTMRPVAAAGHLRAFSTDPVEQRMWDAFGISGQLSGDEFGIGLQNLGVNKLDPYIDIVVEATTARNTDGTATISLTATIRNNTPPNLPIEVTGEFWQELGLPTTTTYLGRIALLLPGATLEVDLDDTSEAGLEVFGVDGNNVVVATKATIVDGDARVLSADITLAAGVDKLTMQPSARYPTILYYWNGVPLDDFGPHKLPIE